MTDRYTGQLPTLQPLLTTPPPLPGSGTWGTSVSPGGDLNHVTPWGHATVTGAVPYPPLGGDGSELDQRLQVPGSQRLEVVSGDSVNEFDWLYFTEKQGRGRGRRVAKVRGDVWWRRVMERWSRARKAVT